jgi:hypothetical protein
MESQVPLQRCSLPAECSQRLLLAAQGTTACWVIHQYINEIKLFLLVFSSYVYSSKYSMLFRVLGRISLQKLSIVIDVRPRRHVNWLSINFHRQHARYSCNYHWYTERQLPALRHYFSYPVVPYVILYMWSQFMEQTVTSLVFCWILMLCR